MLGYKIIDKLLIELDEYAGNLSMIDKIHKIERLEIIERADLWKEMRLARNHVAHEYPNYPELTAAYLHEIIRLTPLLIQVLHNIKKKLSRNIG